MTTITIEEAQAKLPELIGGLSRGEELAIVKGDRVVARLVAGSAGPDSAEGTSAEVAGPEVAPGPVASGPWPCKAGSAKDKILWMSPDFDEPLEEFREYMG